MTITMLIIVSFALACFAIGGSKNVRDALTKVTRALPASTTAVTSTAIDTGTSPTGVQVADYEFLLTAPAVATGQLPDDKTFTYDIIHSDNSDLSSPSTLMPGVIVQTGAGGAGAAGSTYRFKLPDAAKRYIGVKVTPAASGTGDASAATASLEPVF